MLDSFPLNVYTGGPNPPATFYHFGSPTLASTVQSMVSGVTANFGFIVEKNSGNDNVGYTWGSSRWDANAIPFLQVYWSADGVQLSPAYTLHGNGAELYWQHYAGGLGAYPTAVLADSPVAYWRLDEGTGDTTVWDWSGNDESGTVQTPASVTRGVAGALGDGDTATSFASSSYIDVPDDTALHVNDLFTVEFWLKRSSLTATTATLVSQFDTGFNVRLNTSNKIELREPSPSNSIAQSTGTVADLNWHHVAVTKSGSTVHIYIDGTEGTGAVTNQTLTRSEERRVGKECRL